MIQKYKRNNKHCNMYMYKLKFKMKIDTMNKNSFQLQIPPSKSLTNYKISKTNITK